MARRKVTRSVNDKHTYHTLTYAGVMPFLAGAILPWLGVTSLGPLGAVYPALLSYGLAIVSFLCGTQWAVELAGAGSARLPLFLLSNLIVVATWLAALAAPLGAALLVQIAALAILLAVDGRLRGADRLSGDYWILRQRITLIACIALAVAIVGTWR